MILNVLIPPVITFYAKNQACMILNIQNWIFLSICASANKLQCAIISLHIRLTSLVVFCKGQCWDHIYSCFIHVGGNAQTQSLSGNEIILRYEDTSVALIENSEYLEMSINFDISCDFHVQRLCQKMYYQLSLLRQLQSMIPKELHIYKIAVLYW